MNNRGKYGQIIDTATQRCKARRLSHGGNEVASRLARLKEEDLAKAAGSHTTWVVCDMFHSGHIKRIEERSGGVLGEGGAAWEMAATRLHNDVFSDSEEHHERAPVVSRWQERHRVG